MSDRKNTEEFTKLEDFDFTPDGDAHEGITDHADAMPMGEDVGSGGVDFETQQQVGMALGGYGWAADELPDLDQGALDSAYDNTFPDMLQREIAEYAGYVPLQPEELHAQPEVTFEQPMYEPLSPSMPVIDFPNANFGPPRPAQRYEGEQYTMRRSVEATVTTSAYRYAIPTYLGQPEEPYAPQEDADTTQELPEEEPETVNKRLSGRSGIPRAPRHRDAIAVSDPPPRVSERYVFQPQQPRRLTQGRAESGRNLMALFGDDEEPKLKYPMTIERGRKGQYYSSKHQSWDEPLPAGLTLKQVCNDYPNHVWGSGLRIFMRENWDAERIYRELPTGCKPDGAEQRKWNYLQQAMGREDDRMAQEDGNPREPQKKTPEKRQGGRGADDSDYGDDEGDWEPGSSGAKRRRTRRGSTRRHGPERRAKTIYTSSDFMRSEQEHNNDNGYDHDAHFFSQPPVQQQLGAPVSYQQAQVQPQMGSSYPWNQYPQYQQQSQFSMPAQQLIVPQPMPRPSSYLSMNPDHIEALSLPQLDDAEQQLRAQIINQIFQDRRMTDPHFQAQPPAWQFAQAQRRYHDFERAQFNRLLSRHDVDDMSPLRQAMPLDIYEALLRSLQSSTGDTVVANRSADFNLEARRKYVGQLIMWARDPRRPWR